MARDHQREVYSRRVGGLLSGETVTPGKYRCQECDYELEVEDGKVTNLPVCPSCQSEDWQLA
jgi:Zn finger protein HypA/HybF involved in hydrogenase expression